MTTANVDTSSFDSARLEAQKQWNANPCGALPTDVLDKAYFDRVEENRYRQQYWQRDWFDYTSFRGKKVLEIGIGLGIDLKQFARNGAECYGVDITDKHIELTRQNFAVNGFTVDVHKADATALPFTDGFFDCVHSFGVLHHIPDVGRALAEIRRVLKPDGVLQTAVYNLYSVHTATLFASALANGELFTKGIDGILATIELGADGVKVKPYVKLYSKREWTKTVAAAGFTPLRTGVRQVYFHDDSSLNKLRPFEGKIGWYVCGVFRR